MRMTPDRLTARCSLWWSGAPQIEGERLGCVGHYAAESDEAARAVLEEAGRRLRRAGCTRALGPMDGATWRPYRFAVDGAEDAPPFFLEPQHPAAHRRHFRQAGFTPWMRYRSAQVPLAGHAPAARTAAERKGDVRLRALRLARFDAELRRLYTLATESFAENVLYTPLPEAVFEKQYRALRPRIDPALVRIAERDGRPVGFCFGVPDHCEHERRHEASRRVNTVVLKTLAVHSTARGDGLGTRLVADLHRVARAGGYRHVIHALIREGNASNRISNHFPGSRLLRRYALFSKHL
jgi:GNAT superfamily N-acetyltransferase